VEYGVADWSLTFVCTPSAALACPSQRQRVKERMQLVDQVVLEERVHKA
jgi:hypothetical protein